MPYKLFSLLLNETICRLANFNLFYVLHSNSDISPHLRLGDTPRGAKVFGYSFISLLLDETSFPSIFTLLPNVFGQ